MTATQRKTFAGLGVVIGAPLTVALLTWAFGKYDKSKVDTSRFVADSISRAGQDVLRDTLLLRIDRRTRAMYCSKLPLAEQAACQ